MARLGWILALFLLVAGTSNHPSHAATKKIIPEAAILQGHVEDLERQLDLVSIERDSALSQGSQEHTRADFLQAQVDDLTGQVRDLKNQLASLSGGRGGGPGRSAVNTSGNRFYQGQCTWYVYNLRPVPWLGNANQWLAGAQQYGWPTGPVPRVGAIMVSAESGWGHVALVLSVGLGWFTVTEMNYYGVGVPDTRTVRLGTVPILGFIY